MAVLLGTLSDEDKQQLVGEAKELIAETVKQASDELQPRYLNRKQAAKYLGISTDTFDNLRSQGLFRPIKYPGVSWIYYDRKDLDKAVSSCKIGG